MTRLEAKHFFQGNLLTVQGLHVGEVDRCYRDGCLFVDQHVVFVVAKLRAIEFCITEIYSMKLLYEVIY